MLSPASLGKLDHDSIRLLSGIYPLKVRLNETLLKIPFEISVQNLLSKVLESNKIRIHMPPAARFILPGNSAAGVPAHQDIYYNKQISDFITMWVPLVPINETSGAVRIFKKSDKIEYDFDISSNSVWIDAIDTNGFESFDCTSMDIGDVLIFNKLLIHESIPNISKNIRYSIEFRFFGHNDNSTLHYLDLQSKIVKEPMGEN